MSEEFKETLIDYGITDVRLNLLFDYFDGFRKKIKEGQIVTSGSYEQKFYEIAEVQHGDYHAAENFLLECAKTGRYQDLFVRFYSGMAKHKKYIEEFGFRE